MNYKGLACYEQCPGILDTTSYVYIYIYCLYINIGIIVIIIVKIIVSVFRGCFGDSYDFSGHRNFKFSISTVSSLLGNLLK